MSTGTMNGLDLQHLLGRDARMGESDRTLLDYALKVRENHTPGTVACPAALQLGLTTCQCRVDGSRIAAHRDPKTFYGWCTAEGEMGYQTCPVWRAHKDRTAAAIRAEKEHLSGASDHRKYTV